MECLDRELAAVLTALRFWQQSLVDVPVKVLIAPSPQFAALRPLLPIEIDALCERLSAGCDCEVSGPYACGIPGVLARIADGRIRADSVERCDGCERFPSDEAARRYLRELGWLPAVN